MSIVAKRSPISATAELLFMFYMFFTSSVPPYQVVSWSIQVFGRNRWDENLGLCPLFEEWRWVPIKHNVAWAEAYLLTKWHLDPYSRLATTYMGRKLGVVPLWRRWRWVPILHNVARAKLGLPPCQVSSSSIQPFGHNTPTSQRRQDRQTTVR